MWTNYPDISMKWLSSKLLKWGPWTQWIFRHNLKIFLRILLLLLFAYLFYHLKYYIFTNFFWFMSWNSLFFLFWSTVDLQCFANLCYPAKWLSLTHTYILFYTILFHYGFFQEIGYRFLVPYSWTLLLFIHPKFNSLHLPTPDSQSIPLPPLHPLGNKSDCSMCLVSILQLDSFVSYFTFHI